MIKSGADYKNLSFITIEERELTDEEKERIPQETITDKNAITEKIYSYSIKNNKYAVNIQKYDVTTDVEPDHDIQEYVDEYYRDLDKKMKIVNSKINTDLDVKFSSVRAKETKIGNFIADMMKKHFHADIGLLNSGAFRPDKIYPEGHLTVGDWFDIFPFTTPIIKVLITGEGLHRTLENSVSKYPSYEGRFLQVSGVSFKFDPSKEPGNRIKKEDIEVRFEPLDYEKKYTLACSYYMGLGKEDFTEIAESEHVVDIENSPQLKHILGEFFGKILFIVIRPRKWPGFFAGTWTFC